MNSPGAGWDPVAAYCLDSNETSAVVKSGEFLHQLTDCRLFKKCARWK